MKSICEIDEYRTKYWLNENDQLHREDGPAIEETDGHKEWWINGKLHREDGPAIKFYDGYKEYFLNGIQYSKKEYYRRIKLKVFW